MNEFCFIIFIALNFIESARNVYILFFSSALISILSFTSLVFIYFTRLLIVHLTGTYLSRFRCVLLIGLFERFSPETENGKRAFFGIRKFGLILQFISS